MRKQLKQSGAVLLARREHPLAVASSHQRVLARRGWLLA